MIHALRPRTRHALVPAGVLLATLTIPAAGMAQDFGIGVPGPVLYRQRCASCHDARPDAPEAARTPPRATLAKMSRAQILAALGEGGAMASMATGLTLVERAALAAFVSTVEPPAVDPEAGRCTTPSGPLPDPASMPQWNGWGNGPANTRFQSAAAAGLTAAAVPKLQLKWAFGIPGATSVSGQPTVVSGRVFVGTEVGLVYALDAATGCVRWSFTADGNVRSAITVAAIPDTRPTRYAAYFGDLRANVYAVDAASGALIWKVKVEDHASARITGAPTYWNGRLYVPVSSLEEGPGARPDYPCCTFRGSVVALEGATGARVWKTYTIPEAPAIVGRNAAGTPLWKPAGAAIWAVPTIDASRGLLYVATGNAYTEPAAPTSDAVLAMRLDSGAVQWVSQVTPNDTYVIGCRPDNDNCPDDVGPDFDFGNSPILRTLAGGRRVLVVGQKSGVAYGLDPDARGAVLWRYRAGKGSALGGIEWGSAADERVMYVPVSDVLHPEAGGLHAIGIGSGERIWHTPAPAPRCTTGQGCSSAQSAAISVIPGVVFSGAVDGHLRAYDATDGRIIWTFDTARDFTTVNGVPASGGSIDGPGPTVAGGMVFAGSGYGRWRGRPGNVLLAFAVP
ncbi:MAG: PQQ-binding-like beta-propeller repeat protein [Vicinamibacterales bacterium]